MHFCSPTEDFWPAWKAHGLSHCFIESVGPATLLLWLTITCFTSHWGLLRSQTSSVLLPAPTSSRPKLFILQICLSLLVPVILLVRQILLVTYLSSEDGLCGYMLVCSFTGIISWPLALRLTFSEKKRTITPFSTKGHSVPLLMYYSGAFVYQNLMVISWNSNNWWFHLNTTQNIVELVFFIMQYVLSGSLLLLAFLSPGLPDSRGLVSARHLQHDDRQAFLETGDGRRRSAFANFFYKMKLLFPFIWPKNHLRLQFQVLLCILLLLCGRAIAVFVPLVNKAIINSLAGPKEELEYRWDYILIYVALWYCQGQGGNSFFSNCRSFLWIRVQQYTVKSIESEVYSHLHSLSLRWHLNRKTGEVLRICDRGTNSVTSLLNYIIFNIFPTVADIVIAVVYFTSAFNAWFGLIVFLTMAIYLVLLFCGLENIVYFRNPPMGKATTITIGVTEWRTKYRRAMNKMDNAAEAKAVDALLNFETVKYYNAEDYEVEAYKTLIDAYQVCEWKSSASMTLLNTLQGTVITLGVMTGSLLCAHMVADQELTVGDYVLFSSYLLQLYTPLNFFGTYYRLIQTAFVDMENMFDLLKVEPEVNDVMNAPPLKVSGSEVRFENVSFHYLSERPVLKNISFVIPSGNTVALVGPSGSGKSTIIRLMFRLYDANLGTIFFDNQDIKQVQQKSLRKNIGVVPQDTVLFNDSIRYNIRYGRVEATDAEIEDAACAADIHDQILTFPNGYETVVGERGLKLSGGEKQRVAIARTVLKNPPLVLLDEATSSLDTQTERNIQMSLNKMCVNRTTLVVAHRLSTIVNADIILVLKDGEIVERGRHQQLIDLGGLYASMWQQQQKDQNTEQTEEANEEENKEH